MTMSLCEDRVRVRLLVCCMLYAKCSMWLPESELYSVLPCLIPYYCTVTTEIRVRVLEFLFLLDADTHKQTQTEREREGEDVFKHRQANTVLSLAVDTQEDI